MTDSPPSRLTAGDLWTWTAPAAAASHPAPDWSLSYVLRPEAGGAGVVAVAAWDGGLWSVSIAPAATAPLAAGRWSWAALATDDGGARATLGAGGLDVAPDPATFAGDGRSEAVRVLAAIEAAIAGRATDDAESYTIEGRSLARTPVADLLRLRNVYRAQVAAERGHSAPFRIRRITH